MPHSHLAHLPWTIMGLFPVLLCITNTCSMTAMMAGGEVHRPSWVQQDIWNWVTSCSWPDCRRETVAHSAYFCHEIFTELYYLWVWWLATCKPPSRAGSHLCNYLLLNKCVRSCVYYVSINLMSYTVFCIQFPGIAKSSIFESNYTAVCYQLLLTYSLWLKSVMKIGYPCEQYQLYPHKTYVQNYCPKLQTQAIIKTQVSVLHNNAHSKL